jgi:hypothetical protein
VPARRSAYLRQAAVAARKRACALKRSGAQAWQSYGIASLRPVHHAVQGFVRNDARDGNLFMTFSMIEFLTSNLAYFLPFYFSVALF